MDVAAASCSSFAASSQSPKKYDVFISFRGEDTRFNFTSHLHDALLRNKIETYIDYRPEKGEEVWPALVKAIEDSTLFLIVFSENYASSTWCLNELTKILECSKDQGQSVIPVFYRIDPSQVRKQTGSYQIVFSEHQHTISNQQVQKWKASLTHAANLSGWHCDAQRNEAELIRIIVKCVLVKLDSVYQMDYSNDFIGINQQIAHLESLLCNESQDVRFIGIWGMGGIGKTTIAKELFMKLCFAFESFCFLNVKEELEKHGITHLKSRLFSTLLEDEKLHVGTPNGESPYVLRRLSRKKVLVVLDDVNDLEQLRNLVGRHQWFGQGSRIIITSRDKQVLKRHADHIYEVETLNFYEALQLFILNAFKHNSLDEEFKQLSEKVVRYAKGVPLALIVLGSLLYGGSKEEWKSQLEKLKKLPCTKIQQILKLSYDSLDREEKNIFLDIACFFEYRRVEQVKISLDACGYSTSIGLKSLQDKALITIFNKIVYMHDLIQEMGQEIVREESLEDSNMRSRLWNTNDIYEILKDNKGSKAIKSIKLDISKIGELKLSPQVFAKMPKLKFLEFYNSSSEEHSLYLPQGLKLLPNEVRYLCWDKYPLKSLPSTFSAENLVELNMQGSNIEKLWHGVQNVVNLKVINLQNSKNLTELPDFSRALHLERVLLSNCASLHKVHPSILSDRLELLQLDGCASLTSLKSDIHVRSLSLLFLEGCSRLKEFSITSENMTRLTLVGTAISEFPSSIVYLSKLQFLRLCGNTNLTNIPSNIIDGLRSLEVLFLKDCCNIFELPDNISTLSSLNLLSIEGSAVERLPASIKHLSSLESLLLNNCTRLRSLQELPPSVRFLLADDCSSLETVQFSSAAEPFKPNKKRTFKNCVKLDEHSIKDILANVLVDVNKSVSQLENCNHEATYTYFGDDKTQVIYPGSRVPGWFKYRITHATFITIDLSSAPRSMDWRFIFCVVSPPFQSMGYVGIECEGRLRIIYDDDEEDVSHSNDEDDYNNEAKVICSCYPVHAVDLTSDHVCLWYDERFCFEMHEKIKETRATSNPKFLLEMNFHCDDFEIKESGVCPTYASEYQNFIKEIGLESQASTFEMEARCSCQNKDEEETLPPSPGQKSKGFIFPPLPNATTWKNGTQGLKDIIFL